MNLAIINKRRLEGWRIIFWCESTSVVCQIATPNNDDILIDVAFSELGKAIIFARQILKREPKELEDFVKTLKNFPVIPNDFLPIMFI